MFMTANRFDVQFIFTNDSVLFIVKMRFLLSLWIELRSENSAGPALCNLSRYFIPPTPNSSVRTCLYACLSVFSFLCQFTGLSVCLSVCFSVCLVWLSVRVSLHQTVLIFDFLFVCPLKFELVCLSGWLSTCSRWFGRLVPLDRRLYINGQFIWLLSAVRSLENKQLPSPLECYRKNTRFKTIHYQHSSFSLIPTFPKEKPNVR